MPILAALQSAAIRLMGQRPTVFFGSSQQFEQEIADLANEVAADVMKSHDWQALTAVHTLTGDGVTDEFDLPADYDRQLTVTDVQDSDYWLWGYQHVADVNDFLFWQGRGFLPSPGAWIIYGGKMRFTPAPPDGQEAVFPYVSRNYARDTATLQNKAAFTADTDQFLLPDRLLTLGLVWRWREQKKLDFSGDQEAFAKAISEYAGRDKGSVMLRRTSCPRLPGTYPAWPWELGGV